MWWRSPIRATFHRGEYRIVCDMRVFALWFTDLVQVASSATAKPVGTLGILFRRREWDLVLAQLREGQAEAPRGTGRGRMNSVGVRDPSRELWNDWDPFDVHN